MSEMVERVARAITDELAKQDGDGAPWVLENGILPYIDQNHVDMFAVARAALDAMAGQSAGTRGDSSQMQVAGCFVATPSLTQASQAFWEAATNEHERKHAERNPG